VTTVKFKLGRIVATPGAIDALRESNQTFEEFLDKHVAGDWGEQDKHDKKVNNAALAHGGRIVSVYTTSKGVKIWIITEANRAVTTILLPDEY
jgi:hypothetical protein